MTGPWPNATVASERTRVTEDEYDRPVTWSELLGVHKYQSRISFAFAIFCLSFMLQKLSTTLRQFTADNKSWLSPDIAFATHQGLGFAGVAATVASVYFFVKAALSFDYVTTLKVAPSPFVSFKPNILQSTLIALTTIASFVFVLFGAQWLGDRNYLPKSVGNLMQAGVFLGVGCVMAWLGALHRKRAQEIQAGL